MDLNQQWQAGGFGMFPILMLLLAAGPAALVTLGLGVAPKLAKVAVVVSTVTVALGLLAAGFGVIGYLDGVRGTERAVAHVSPEDRQSILSAGEAESSIALRFGLLVGFPTMAVGAAVFAVGLQRLKRASLPPVA